MAILNSAWRAWAISIFLVLSPPVDARKAPPSQELQERYAWNQIAIGGGGFITGIDQDASGQTFVARTDVYGAYIWDRAADRWRQLVLTDTVPQEWHRQDALAEGVYEIVVAPSKPDRLYMALRGVVFRSDDAGITWKAAGTANPFPMVWDPNSEFRLSGPFMAVSPDDPDVVLLGTPADGLWRSADAGRTWTLITTVPPAKDRRDSPGVQAPGPQIWFDPTAAGARGRRVLAMSSGNGMFVSDDSGQTFRKLSTSANQPTSLRRGAFDRKGRFLGTDDVAKTVWVLDRGEWTDLGASAKMEPRIYGTVAVNPRRNQILVLDEGGSGYVSDDGGTTWDKVTHDVIVDGPEPPWLRVSNSPYFSTAQVRFDPVVPDRIWVAAGVGVFFADLPRGKRQLVWHSHSRGIEEIVANDIVQAPGQSVVLAGWDFGMHVKPDLRAYSTTFAPGERALMTVHQVDWSPSNPKFLVSNASDARFGCCFEDGNAVMAGTSTDGGRTWTKFPTLPQPPEVKPDDPWRVSFGTIAVSANDTKNIVWAPAFNRPPFFTLDGGQTWAIVDLPGHQGNAFGSYEQFYYQRKTLASDKVRPGTFYLYHSGEGENAKLLGLWVTHNGGRAWTRAFTGEIAPVSNMGAKLRAVPGEEGHLFFTSAFPHTTDTRLRRSIDGGRTWRALDQVTRVDDIAFGKAAPNAQYPAIYLSGRVNGLYGIWRSVDSAQTWTRLADFPVGSLDQVTVVGADPDHFGRVYVGYKGSGWVWGEPARCAAGQHGKQAGAHCTSLDVTVSLQTLAH